MKHKRIVVVGVAIVLLCVTSLVYSKWHTFFPSQQMKTLRQIDNGLNMPKPKYRYEVDTGYSTDWKGVQHFDRSIVYGYADTEVLNTLRSKLLSDGWQEQAVNVTDYFLFTKGEGKTLQCINGYINLKNSDGVSLHVNISAPENPACLSNS